MHSLLLLILNLFMIPACSFKEHSAPNADHAGQEGTDASKLRIGIILGSTRNGRLSETIGLTIKRIADQRTDITTHLIDLRDYPLHFLHEEVAPALRTEITDPAVQAWANVINHTDAFIMVTPEYNGSFPGVLKNALDSLYKEWQGKPVGFVGYSGGPSGGTGAISHLQKVTESLRMHPITTTITIPYISKVIDWQGLNQAAIDTAVMAMIDQCLQAQRDKNAAV